MVATAGEPRIAFISRGVGAAAVGVGIWGSAPLAEKPGWAVPGLLAGLLTAVALVVHGWRAQRRRDLVARLAEAIGPLFRGGRPGRSSTSIRTSRWGWGFPGQPARVVIQYTADVDDRDPTWASEVASLASRRLAGIYRASAHDPVRCRLVLQLRRPTGGEPVEETPAVQRARSVIGDLLGPTTHVDRLETNEVGDVVLVEAAHEAGAKLVASGYRRRVEHVVSTLLPGRWRARWDMENDRATFELRPTLPASVWIKPLPPLTSDPLENYPTVEIPFAVDEDGGELVWRPAISPHVMLIGGTGSGKTSTTHAILSRVAQYGWPIWVADGKGVEFLGFRDWPNVQVVASTVEHQVAVVHRAWELMEHRYQLVVAGRARSQDFEPLVVFLDEFADFRANLLAWYAQIKVKGDPTKPVTLMEAASLARKGRTARVHLVMATQRPDADFLTGEMRDNFTMRVSMGRLSPQGAMMMWDNAAVGVALPRGRIGRAIAMNDDGFPVEVQCYRTPDPNGIDGYEVGSVEADIMAQLRPAEARQERLLILTPDVEAGQEGEGLDEPTFTHYTQAAWVKASDRPDLDPLVRRHRADYGEADGRVLASPMAIFGLAGTPSRKWAGEPLTRASHGPADPAPEVGVQPPEDLSEAEVSPTDGYGPPAPVWVRRIEVGDLVQVGPDGHWGVVEEEPTPDVVDDDCLVIAWRDDQDNAGQLVVPADGTATVCRPDEGGF